MKKVLSLLLLLALLCSLFACAAPQPPVVTDTESSKKTDETDGNTDEPSVEKPTTLPEAADLYGLDYNAGNYVLAANQFGNTVLLYDLDFYENDLESCMIWELQLKENGMSNVSGIKFRQDTVYGDVVVVACSGGLAAVYKFPNKKKIWSVASCGNNPHSIEILPNGAVVTAASTGSEVRIYDTSVEGDAGLCGTYSFGGAHAVLWDPKYQVVWALGSKELASFEFIPNNASGGKLKLKQSYTLPNTNHEGHELSIDMSNNDIMFATTDEGVLRFNKVSGTFSSVGGQLTHHSCKGYGNNPLGNTVYCFPSGGEGTGWAAASFHEWCTDTICFYDAKTKKTTSCKSKYYAFYKVFAFCGQYLQQKKK